MVFCCFFFYVVYLHGAPRPRPQGGEVVARPTEPPVQVLLDLVVLQLLGVGRVRGHREGAMDIFSRSSFREIKLPQSHTGSRGRQDRQGSLKT